MYIEKKNIHHSNSESGYNFTTFVITLKSNDFAERGFCYKCKVNGNKVTIYSDLSRAVLEELIVISIEQFNNEFKEMTEDDYESYMLANCNDEPDTIRWIREKYLN